MAEEETASEYSLDDAEEIAAEAAKILSEQSLRSDTDPNKLIDLKRKLEECERDKKAADALLQHKWDIAADIDQAVRGVRDETIVLPARVADAARHIQMKPTDPIPPRRKDMISPIAAGVSVPVVENVDNTPEDENVNNITVEPIPPLSDPWLEETRPVVSPAKIPPDTEGDRPGPSGVSTSPEKSEPEKAPEVTNTPKPERPSPEIPEGVTGFGDECFPPLLPRIKRPASAVPKVENPAAAIINKSPAPESNPQKTAEPFNKTPPPENGAEVPPVQNAHNDTPPILPNSPSQPKEMPTSEEAWPDQVPQPPPKSDEDMCNDVPVISFCGLVRVREVAPEDTHEVSCMAVEVDQAEISSNTTYSEADSFDAPLPIDDHPRAAEASATLNSSSEESFGHDCFKNAAPSQSRATPTPPQPVKSSSPQQMPTPRRYPVSHKIAQLPNFNRQIQQTQPQASSSAEPKSPQLPSKLENAPQSTPENPQDTNRSRQPANDTTYSRQSCNDTYQSSAPSRQYSSGQPSRRGPYNNGTQPSPRHSYRQPSPRRSYSDHQPTTQRSNNSQPRPRHSFQSSGVRQQQENPYSDIHYIEGEKEYANVADVWEQQADWQITEPPSQRRAPDHLNSQFAPRGLPRYMLNAFDRQRNSIIETDYIICYSNGFISIGVIRDKEELRRQPVILQFGTWASLEDRQLHVGVVVRVCEFAKIIQTAHGPKPAMHWNDSIHTRFIYKGMPVPAGLATKWHIVSRPSLIRDLGYVTDFQLRSKSTSNYTNIRYWGRVYDQQAELTTDVHDDHWSWYSQKLPHNQMGVILNWVHLEWPHLDFVDPDSKCHIPMPLYLEKYLTKAKHSNAEYYLGWVDTRFPRF